MGAVRSAFGWFGRALAASRVPGAVGAVDAARNVVAGMEYVAGTSSALEMTGMAFLLVLVSLGMGSVFGALFRRLRPSSAVSGEEKWKRAYEELVRSLARAERVAKVEGGKGAASKAGQHLRLTGRRRGR